MALYEKMIKMVETRVHVLNDKLTYKLSAGLTFRKSVAKTKSGETV